MDGSKIHTLYIFQKISLPPRRHNYTLKTLVFVMNSAVPVLYVHVVFEKRGGHLVFVMSFVCRVCLFIIDDEKKDALYSAVGVATIGSSL